MVAGTGQPSDCNLGNNAELQQDRTALTSLAFNGRELHLPAGSCQGGEAVGGGGHLT
jgi:hypothetical protein